MGWACHNPSSHGPARSQGPAHFQLLVTQPAEVPADGAPSGECFFVLYLPLLPYTHLPLPPPLSATATSFAPAATVSVRRWVAKCDSSFLLQFLRLCNSLISHFRLDWFCNSSPWSVGAGEIWEKEAANFAEKKALPRTCTRKLEHRYWIDLRGCFQLKIHFTSSKRMFNNL